MENNETNTENQSFKRSRASLFFSPPAPADRDDETTLTPAQLRIKLADAITKGDKKKVKKYTANVSLDALPVPALILAVQSNQLKMIRYLIKRFGADINSRSSQKISPLMAAAAKGNLDAVNLLLRYRPLVDDTDNKGSTALMMACSKQGEQYHQCAKALIAANADVNHQNLDGYTPLMNTAITRTSDTGYESLSSSLNNQSITQLLLDHGANPNLINKQRQTALDLSKENNTPLVAALILGLANQEALDYVKKAFINTGTFCHQLKKAIDTDDTKQIIEICFIIDTDTINARRREDRSNSYMDYTIEHETLLEYAVAETKSLDIITFLLKAKAKPAVGSYSGYSSYTNPLMLTDDEKIIDLLLEYGADINTTDSAGNTKLHHAVQKGTFGLAALLKSKGANLSKTNKSSETAYLIAKKMGHKDMMSLLGDGQDEDAKEISLINNGIFCNQLKKAIKSNKTEEIRRICVFIDEKTINARRCEKVRDDFGNHNVAYETLLEYAVAEKKSLEIITLLLDAKAQPAPATQSDLYSYEYTHPLVLTDDREIIDLLLEYGADINTTDSIGNTKLHRAVQNGSLDNSIYFISKGADLSKKNRFSETAYIIAAKMGREDLMTQLSSSLSMQALELQALELLDSVILSGNTKLFTSLYAGKSLSLLKDRDNKTVLHYFHNGRLKLEMLHLLLPRLAPNELNAIDNHGITPLFVVFLQNSEKELAPLFMTNGANPNYGRFLSAPLLSFAILNKSGAIESLLQAGANPALTDDKGNNALHVFVENKLSGAYGFNFWNQIATRDTVNARNQAGMTPLEMALDSHQKNGVIINHLIESGANPELLSAKATTAYNLWEEEKINLFSYRR